MAKTIRDEELKLTLVINGDPARKELYELDQQRRKLLLTQKQLIAEQKKLEKAGQQETAAYRTLTDQIKQNGQALDENKAKMNQIKATIGLTNLSLKELRETAKQLRKQRDLEPPGTAEWNRLNKALNETEGRMNELRGSGQKMNGILGSIFGIEMTRGQARFAAGFTAITAAVTAALYALYNYITKSAEIADAQANVRKTTELLVDDMNQLQFRLDRLNTRTSRLELLSLAEEAGRLGRKSVKDIMEFVKVADKIKVALGDDLGGDEAIRQIGKLAEQYLVAQRYGVGYGESLEKIGSGINEVAASGSNQANYLVDFMSRTSGLAQLVNLQAGAVLGFAAALDEAGQQVEVSATAFNMMLPNMFEDTTTYARVAGMELSAFKELLDKDINEALLRVLEGLKGNNEGFDIMNAKLNELGIEGSRGTQVLASLASNTDKIRLRQSQANKAMQEGISLTNEYNIKNENLAASWEKVKRKISDTWLNSGFMTAIEGALGKMAKWIEIPLSEQLEMDRRSLRALEMQLIATNMPLDERIKKINELKDQYPDLLSGINAEIVTNEQLANAIDKVNESMLVKIRHEALAEKLREKAIIQVKEENLLRKTENWLLEFYADNQEELRRKQNESIEDYGRRLKEAGKLSAAETGQFNYLLGEYEKAQRRLNIAVREYNTLMGEQKAELPFGSIEGMVGNLTAARNKLEKLLNQASTTSPGTTGSLSKLSHEQIMAKLQAENKQEQAVEAKNLENKLITRDEYEGRLLTIQANYLAKQKLALQKHLADIGKSEIEARAKILGDIADLEKQASETAIQMADKTKPFDLDSFLNDHEKYDEKGNPRNDDEVLAARVKAEKARSAMAQASLAILNSRPGSRDELEAHIQMLEVKKQAELEVAGQTAEEKQLIERQYQADIEKLEEDFNRQRASMYLDTLSGMISTGLTIFNNASEKELFAEQRKNNTKKQDLKRQLDSKLISEEKYRAEIEKIDAEYAKTEAEFKTEQFKRQKIADSIQASINTAVAVTKALTVDPTGILATIVGIMGGLQVAAIATRPIPVFDKGKYPVLGSDGRTYNPDFAGSVRTGYYQNATMMVGERRPEIVIDGATTAHLMKYRPEVVDAIYAAAGKYNPASVSKASSFTDYSPVTSALSRLESTLSNRNQQQMPDPALAEMARVLKSLQENGVPAYLGWRQYQDFKETAETLEKNYRV